MKRSIIWTVALLAVMCLAAVGCGKDEKDSCIDNETKYCQCMGGMWGAQLCSFGSWSPCQCGSDNNNSLAIALTGHDSEETVSTNTITISGTTPDGRGDGGSIRLSNPSFGAEQPPPIPISVMEGSYSQTVNLGPGENTIGVAITEASRVLVEVSLKITSTYGDDRKEYDPSDLDTDADTDGDTDADADTEIVEMICSPNEERSCDCEDGSKGVQWCNEQGTVWGMCECEGGAGDSDSDGDVDTEWYSDTDADTDSDTDADTDSDSDSDADSDTDTDTGLYRHAKSMKCIICDQKKVYANLAVTVNNERDALVLRALLQEPADWTQ